MLARYLIVFSAVSGVAGAQPPQRLSPMVDSSASQIISRMKNPLPSDRGSGFGWVSRILRQQDQPMVKRDAIADALVTHVIAEDAESLGALSAIALAGARGEGAYSGALDRLIRIHREGTKTPGVRTVVLTVLTNVENTNRARNYLRDVAVSEDPSAMYALSALVEEARKGGQAANPTADRQAAEALLRDMFMRDLVKDRFAAEQLLVFAISKGWRRD